MNERYHTDQNLRRIWCRDETLWRMAALEISWLGALRDVKLVPHTVPPDLFKSVYDACRVRFSAWVAEREKVTRHDVAAMVLVLEEMIHVSAPHISRFTHFGLTSSDISDTGLSLAIMESFTHITGRANRVIDALMFTPPGAVSGRTHGVPAEMIDNRGRMYKLGHEIRDVIDAMTGVEFYGKMNGSVGDYPLGPMQHRAEEQLLKALHLSAHPASTQVIPRHVFAGYASLMAILGKVLSRVAVSVRVGIAAGDYLLADHDGAIGSSAMPHKVNPWQLERVCGMARMLSGYSSAILDGVELWLERDISHSCVERTAFEGGFHCLSSMCAALIDVLPRVRLAPVTASQAPPPSQAIMNRLIECDTGSSRSECHRLAAAISSMPPHKRAKALSKITGDSMSTSRTVLSGRYAHGKTVQRSNVRPRKCDDASVGVKRGRRPGRGGAS